jgi:hypothetical protein
MLPHQIPDIATPFLPLTALYLLPRLLLPIYRLNAFRLYICTAYK